MVIHLIPDTLSADCCAEATARSASSCEAEDVFQQDGNHAFYGECTAQLLNTTILLYLRGALGLVIGYLAPLHVKYISKNKVISLYVA